MQLKKTIIGAILLGMILPFAQAFANDLQINPDRGSRGSRPFEPGRGIEPGRGNEPGRVVRPGVTIIRKSNAATEERIVYLDRYYRNQYIDLDFLFNLDPVMDRDLEVIAVEVQARSGNNRSELTLTADNRIQARQPAYINSYLDPEDTLIVGRTYDRLMLHISDKLYVESITLHVSRSSNPPPKNGFDVERTINQSFRGRNAIDLYSAMNLSRYRGYKIAAVFVQGYSLARTAQANLSINSFEQGAINLDATRRVLPIRPRQLLEIGRGADSVLLHTSGDLVVERIIFRLIR
jgi:hypothetical protein